jgi:hypothetical protein
MHLGAVLSPCIIPWQQGRANSARFPRLTPHSVATHNLGLLNGLHEDRQSPYVIVRFRTVTPGRQPIDENARFDMPHERRAGEIAAVVGFIGAGTLAANN